MDFTVSIAALALGFTILNTFYGWYSGTQRATKDEVESHGRNIAAIQAELKNMPNQENFHKLQLDVMEMKGEQRLFAEQIKPIAASIKRIEEFLITEVQTAPAKRVRK